MYSNYILRAEWRFKKEGWVPKPEDEWWPNAGFFINAGPTVDGWPTSQEVQGHFGEAGSLFGVRSGEITGARRGRRILADLFPPNAAIHREAQNC